MRLKSIYTLLTLTAVILLAACNKDEEGTVRITFKATFGNDPLVMQEVHDYANGQRILLSRAEFFLSDLELVDGSGNAQALSDIELVDLTLTTSQDAQAGVSFTFNGIPADNYADLRMGFGVAPDINATVPSGYPSSSPLSNTGRYWVPWSSYIFAKTEGRLDTLIDGSDNPDLGFAYHTGTDDLYLLLNLNNGVPVTKDGSVEVVFILDYAKLLGLPLDPLDIKAKPQNHNPQDTVYLRSMVDNIPSALTYYIE